MVVIVGVDIERVEEREGQIGGCGIEWWEG